MFEKELKLYSFMQHYAGMLLDGINDDQWNHQPFAGANTPTWIIGHLAWVSSNAVALLEHEPFLDEGWKTLFGGGSVVPTAETPSLPSPSEVRDAYATGHERVTSLIPQAASEIFDRPNPHQGLKDTMPTQGGLFAFMMTSHESLHLGQLSAWRRAMGMSPVI